MTQYGKLVRDRIPEIIESDGKRAIFTHLDEAGFRRAVRRKLIEEAAEVDAARDKDRLSEFADLAEVLDAALAAHGFSPDDLLQRRRLRMEERGGFERRIYLESVDG
jgi:predicted house-cleaning noncanonical NTP pyrophosphatase (MazG superfamily)